MKNSIKLIVLLAVGAAGLVSLNTGCAGTSTQESTGEYIDDATITAKVKAAFVKDDTVSAGQVSVTTFKGNVQLSGFVDNAEMKTRAGQIAGTIEGVTNVTNNITVK
jgi:hyperosmotically inducible periplasmic protein